MGAQAWCLLRICMWGLFLCSSAPATDQLSWDVQKGRITADVSQGNLLSILEQIADKTGWQVFVEPEVSCVVSAKFRDLPPGNALPLLLGDLNYALLPSAGAMRLYVFRTSRDKATQQIRARPLETQGLKLIGNELIVRLKPGANIDEIAKALGATVVGRLEKHNLYRLRFDDIAATNAARAALAQNPDVESIENNYALDRPGGGRPVVSTTSGMPQLALRPPPNGCNVVIGLIDTGVQSLGTDLDKFLLPPISIAGASAVDPSVPSHGTSMAATMLSSLAAASRGSTSVKILPVDVYGRSPVTSTFQVAEGIVRAVNAGANVINLSLGTEGNAPYVADLIRQASQSNITFIGAAGNSPVTTPYYPAALPEVLAVTAVEQGSIAPYANRGSFVSVGAPGTSIVNYNGSSYFVIGTSSAAAFTSGIAAAYRESNCAGTQETGNYLRNQLPPPLP